MTQPKNGKLAAMVNIEDLVLFIAGENPDAAYYENDSFIYGFQAAKHKRPYLECLFEGDEPTLILKILDNKNRLILTNNGRRYVRFNLKRQYGEKVFDALKPISEEVWSAAEDYKKLGS